MPYNSAHFAKLEQRREKAVSRLLPCMNDTKWREVFLLIARRNLTFQIAWVGDLVWPTDSYHKVQENLIENNGLRDPGIGGPCVYRDILWIRLPKTVKWGNGNWFAQDLVPFATDLTTLGTMPLQSNEDGIEIRGYQEPS